MSYSVKIIIYVVNMKICWGVLVQLILRQIKDIQDIDSFKCTWKIFYTSAIVILGYEHIFLIHYIFNFNI